MSSNRPIEQRGFLAEQIRLAQESLKTWPRWLRPDYGRCRNCRLGVLPEWKYCPICGEPK